MSSLTVYQNRLKAVRLQTARAAMREWDKLPNFDRPEPFAKNVANIVAAGQMLTARTTNAHIARRAKIKPVRITPDMVTGTAARKGIDPLEEYQRPFGAAYKAFGEGEDYATAKQRGRDRLNVLVLADVWLAMRATTDVIDQATGKITGWVRVADAGACDLCSFADGLPMSQAADMAGHPGCGCTSEPTFADTPESSAEDVQAIDVHEHDELGPVLYEAGQSFAS